MSFTLSEFARVRPFLFHLTARANLPRILRTRRLESTAALATRAQRPELLTTRRRGHVSVQVDGETVLIRDQAPLHLGNMRLESGWTFAQFVAHLNARVFFWPGGPDGPIDYGRRHFARYVEELPTLLRVPFASALRANPGLVPEFCKCNSGSPRWSRGVPGPRGSTTFVPADAAAFRASQVVEVTMRGHVHLPDDAAWAHDLAGPWTAFNPV